jgi:hypothetical protein
VEAMSLILAEPFHIYRTEAQYWAQYLLELFETEPRNCSLSKAIEERRKPTATLPPRKCTLLDNCEEDGWIGIRIQAQDQLKTSSTRQRSKIFPLRIKLFNRGSSDEFVRLVDEHDEFFADAPRDTQVGD